MQSDLIQILIQGGSVGVALVALWVLYKLQSNHIVHHQIEAERFAKAVDRLSDVIDKKL